MANKVSKEQLRDSLGLYFLSVNPGYRWVDFQQDKIIPALEAVERGEIQNLAIFLPPGHSKSDTVTRTFIPWYLGKHPEKNAMVCSYSADLASDDFGARIKKRMASDIHLSVFPKSKLTKESRSKTKFTTISGGDFYSVGYTGSITGKRLDLLVLDDLIKNYEEADSEAVQEALFAIYKGTLKDRMRPGGAKVMCMHRWRERDIAGRILELDGTVEEGGAWKVLNIPAEDPATPGKYLWEDYYGTKYYEDFKKDEDTWFAKFQQNPSGSSNLWFNEEWLDFYDVKPPRGKFKIYGLVDPALKKEKSSDRTSMQFWAAAQEKKVVLVDWVLDRLDPGERMAHLLRLCRKWEPEQLLYEELGLQADTFYISQKMEQDGFPESCYPIPVGRHGPRHMLAKHQRIKLFVPWFREGRIVLPRKYERRLANGTTMDLTKRFIEQEYKVYRGRGSVDHEDDLDNMTRLEEPELQLDFVEQAVDEEDDGGSGYIQSGGSWESSI